MRYGDRHGMYVLCTSLYYHIRQCGKNDQTCGTTTPEICVAIGRHLLTCLDKSEHEPCRTLGVFFLMFSDSIMPVQVPMFQQTDAHPHGRSQWLPPLLLSSCWRFDLQHSEPSGNSWHRISEPGKETSKKQQMLAMSAAKADPHASVPRWVLHCLTMSTYVNYVLHCFAIWSLRTSESKCAVGWNLYMYNYAEWHNALQILGKG